MLFQLIIIVAVILFVSFLFLGFNVFFLKKKFPDTHVGHNENMKKLGIRCVKHEEMALHGNKRKKINPKEIKIIPS